MKAWSPSLKSKVGTERKESRRETTTQPRFEMSEDTDESLMEIESKAKMDIDGMRG
jgi:hypothetical protein